MTSTKTDGTVPQIPRDGIELYDSIMTEIEPALTSTELPKLRDSLRSNSKEKNLEQAKHFTASFKTFQQELTKKKAQMAHDVTDYLKETIRIAEEFSSEMEAKSLQSIEAQISAFGDT